MISSTYLDLAEHRKAAMDALLRLSFFPIGMEFDSAKSGKDIIESSLAMVHKARAYVGIVSHRYGGVPHDPDRNPNELSITEIEYRTALERGIPVYMFLMSDEHPVKRSDVEENDAYRLKLRALKDDARKRSISPEFSSIDALKGLILQSMAELKIEWMETPKPRQRRRTKTTKLAPPPELVAVPEFIAGHEFVGRRDELVWLDQWAKSKDTVLVIEAIGGAGKSTLTWNWVKTRAQAALPNLAGTFWYSFYEGGADMADFAAHALAYATGQALEKFRKRKTAELALDLVSVLQKRPFLLVLDGFERVLVDYHRFDPAQKRDDAETTPDGRACIKPADADFLRRLVTATPSKILITSRLMPIALTNAGGLPLPSVGHRFLGGMDPEDALKMMRGMNVHGDERLIRRYLEENFDNHPLIVGVVGGLVSNYARDPGNFDRWAADPQGGASLHLSTLPLRQRRTHILEAALNGLEPTARQLLSYIAALSYAVPFETIAALNPFGEETAPDALSHLVNALQELEQCGLLQWDRQTNKYDLHPVVRGYAFDTVEQAERAEISNKIVDHFESKPPDRFADITQLAEIQNSITIFRALIHAKRFDDAARLFRGEFALALLTTLEEHEQVLALLAPLFPYGFAAKPNVSDAKAQTYLVLSAAFALGQLERMPEAEQVPVFGARLAIADEDWDWLGSSIAMLMVVYRDTNRLAHAVTLGTLYRDLAIALAHADRETVAYSRTMAAFVTIGDFESAQEEYDRFKPRQMPRDRSLYRMGTIETIFCEFLLYQERLTDQSLVIAETAARQGGNRAMLRALCRVRGELALTHGLPQEASIHFERGIEMSQATGLSTATSEARLAFALAASGDRPAALDICGRLSIIARPPHASLAVAYLEAGDHAAARRHVLAGYPAAWADGPQYSNWWELRLCRQVLTALGIPEPVLPPYDPVLAGPAPLEHEIREVIARLKRESLKREPS